MSRIWGLLAIASFLLPSAGCGKPTFVTGTVTYEGQPVEKGAISFVPKEGQGPTAGAMIEGGKYRVEPIKPGIKVVQIIGVKKVPFARSSEEMAKRAAEAAQRGDSSGLIDPADDVPADAVGNGAEIEVKAGEQKLDFNLKKPAKAPN